MYLLQLNHRKNRFSDLLRNANAFLAFIYFNFKIKRLDYYEMQQAFWGYKMKKENLIIVLFSLMLVLVAVACAQLPYKPQDKYGEEKGRVVFTITDAAAETFKYRRAFGIKKR